MLNWRLFNYRFQKCWSVTYFTAWKVFASHTSVCRFMSSRIWSACHGGVLRLRLRDLAFCDWHRAQKKQRIIYIFMFSRTYLTVESKVILLPIPDNLVQFTAIYKWKRQTRSLEAGCSHSVLLAKQCIQISNVVIFIQKRRKTISKLLEMKTLLCRSKPIYEASQAWYCKNLLFLVSASPSALLCQIVAESSSVPVSSQFFPACPGQHRHSSAVKIFCISLYTGRVDSLYLHTN